MKTISLLILSLLLISCSKDAYRGVASQEEIDDFNATIEYVENDPETNEDFTATQHQEENFGDNVTETDMPNEFAWYEVKKDDTLMVIAYKLYGSVYKWNQIAELNKVALAQVSELEVGMKLQYRIPHDYKFEQPKGEPYIIQQGDYLGKISYKVYDTSKFWQELWYNNYSLVKNPDNIYTGFVLYYLPRSDIFKKDMQTSRFFKKKKKLTDAPRRPGSVYPATKNAL